MAEDLKNAIEKGDLEAVSALLEKGISVNETLESEFTPLLCHVRTLHLHRPHSESIFLQYQNGLYLLPLSKE